ncbi:hypothetical protein GCM10018965_061630 [Nonomuraea roseola]
MDGVRPGLGGDAQQLGDVEVGLGRRPAAERVSLAGDPDVERVEVLLGVDGDAGEPGVLARPGDPHGDLATIGDQNFPHRRLSLLDQVCKGV